MLFQGNCDYVAVSQLQYFSVGICRRSEKQVKREVGNRGLQTSPPASHGCCQRFVTLMHRSRQQMGALFMESICLTPPRPTLDARHLDQLIVLWLDHQSKRVSQRTVDGYTEKIKYFLDWWAITGPDCEWMLTEETLLDFNSHLNAYISQYGRPLAYHTRKDALRRLRQMFFWSRTKGYITSDFAKLIPEPSGAAPVRQAAPLDCLRRLIEATDHSPYPTRDRAILAVLLGCGVRRAECASINLESVRIDADGAGELQVVAKRVKGQTTQIRTVAFDSATGRYIRSHLDTLVGKAGPFFPSRRGPRLTPMGVYKAVKHVIRLADLEAQIQGCHDLRRYFTTYYSRNRRGEGHGHLLSKQLGHSTYRMTAHYSLQDVEDIKEVIISPFALLDGDDQEA